MQTAEKYFTKEITKIMARILDSTYAKTDLEYVAAITVHINAKKSTKIIGLLKEIGYLFDGTIGEWDTEPANIEWNQDSRPFIGKFYPYYRIKKEKFRREPQYLFGNMSINYITTVSIHNTRIYNPK